MIAGNEQDARQSEEQAAIESGKGMESGRAAESGRSIESEEDGRPPADPFAMSRSARLGLVVVSLLAWIGWIGFLVMVSGSPVPSAGAGSLPPILS